MDAGSPRVRMVWRGLALLFAVSVVAVRLGIAGCGPAFYPPTKAGGGFNPQSPPEPPHRPVNLYDQGSPPAAKSTTKNATPAAKPAPTAAPSPRLYNPLHAADQGRGRLLRRPASPGGAATASAADKGPAPAKQPGRRASLTPCRSSTPRSRARCFWEPCSSRSSAPSPPARAAISAIPRCASTRSSSLASTCSGTG